MNKEIKEICSKCEYHIHCQGKGCAFRSLGNEYCDEVENANNLINDLQQRIDKAIYYIEHHYLTPSKTSLMFHECEKVLKILKGDVSNE